MKKIGQFKKAAALLIGAVMCFSAAGAPVFAAQESASPSGAALKADESGDHYSWFDDEMVYDGLSYAKNVDRDGLGCIFKYVGDAKKIYIPEELGGLKINALDTITSDKDGKVIDFENNTVEEIFLSSNIEFVSFDFLDRFKALKAISVSNDNEYFAESDGVLYDKSKGCIEYYPSKKGGELNPPKEWWGECYDDKTKIKSITLNSETVLGQEDHFSFYFWGYTALDKIQVDPNNNFGLKNVMDSVAKEKDGKLILWSCPAMKSDTYVIPEGVTDVESLIFSMDGTQNPLRKIVFPSTYDPEGDFIVRGYLHGIYGVTDFEVSKDNPKYKSVDGIVFDKTGETIVCFPAGRLGSYRVPDGVTKIGDFAFSCSRLLELSMADSVTSIGDHAIKYCVNLRRISLSDNLEELGYSGMSFNDTLEYVELPPSLKTIGYDCFYGCEKLKAIKIPETIDDFYGTFYYDENKQEWVKDESSLYFKDLFVEAPVTVYCAAGSPAEEMAKKENIPYKNISLYDPSGVIVPDINTLGDVDLSGDVTAQDALIALRASISLETLTAEQKTRADTNLDSDVTAADALDILRHSIGFDFSLFA